jgi:signal peptidase II
VTLPLYLLDQATKLWTVRHFTLGEQKQIIPGWFDWVHFPNTGAAFGIMHDNNGFFIGLSVVALVGIAWACKRGFYPGRLNQTGMLLLVSGILGNVTDRLVHGYVVDFLFFDLHVPPANPWPAFNVADSCICAAVGLMLLATFRTQEVSE